MALTAEDVRGIARLARIALSDEEVYRAQEELSSILEHFEVLSEIDTEGVPPTAQSFSQTNVVRPDEPGEPSARLGPLTGAPRQEDGYFRVRAVLD